MSGLDWEKATKNRWREPGQYQRKTTVTAASAIYVRAKLARLKREAEQRRRRAGGGTP